MAPRKNKTQGKRNIKIKSKVNNRKREPKSAKKIDPNGKPLNNFKWLNKAVADGSVKKCEALQDWFKNTAFKHSIAPKSSETNVSDYADYPRQDVEEKSSASEVCNCSHSKYADNGKGGILKSKVSSNSLVSKYIKSGMNTVASFIVESAIRFGEQHGVVVPDKDTPNLYEITPPDNRFADKYRKIRFKVPEKSNYDDAKKLLWKNYGKSFQLSGKRAQTPMPQWEGNQTTKSSSWESTPDSLEEILPILEKLKEGEDIVSSDLDLEKLRKANIEEVAKIKEREKDWERARERERGRSRERERDRMRNNERGKERLRQKLRTLRKRYKSLGDGPEKDLEDKNLQSEWNRWKKCKRDSVELGRQRMRATTCPRKQDSLSPSAY